MIKVCILDYGSGNVQSVRNLLQHLKVKSTISNKNKAIQDSTHIILPGVGAFGEAIKKLRKNIDIDFLEKEVLKNKKPFLGICVGMQLLAEVGIFGTIPVLIALVFVSMKIFFHAIRIVRSEIRLLKDYEICLYSLFFINLFPFIPTLSFFNNWNSIMIYLPVSFILINIDSNEVSSSK